MSRTIMHLFKGGLPAERIEYSNAWGSAARIWDSLYKKYLKNPKVEDVYDHWIFPSQLQRLWDLARDGRLQEFERAVHTSTFDKAYVKRDNFLRFSEHLKAFDKAHPAPSGNANHLTTWVKDLEYLLESCPTVEAIAFHQTSVAEDPWHVDKDEWIPQHLSTGFEVYHALENELKPI